MNTILIIIGILVVVFFLLRKKPITTTTTTKIDECVLDGTISCSTTTEEPEVPEVPSNIVEITNDASSNGEISSVRINGQSIVWERDTNFPIEQNKNGTFSTTEIGSYTVDVDVTHLGGSCYIKVLDSTLSPVDCFEVTGSNTFSFVNVDVANGPIASGIQVHITFVACS